MKYIVAIDQSTSGTKALLFDEKGALVYRADTPHRQIIPRSGWVEHDAAEIYQNTLASVKKLLLHTGIDAGAIAGVGISNQRETGVIWNRKTGNPLYHAIVWQCSRGESICRDPDIQQNSSYISQATGLFLSPYFTAAKFGWLIKNIPEISQAVLWGDALCGTIDSWLIYKLTGGKIHKTDHSNASRTQLFHIGKLQWDEEICRLFGLNISMLPEPCPSDSAFGETDFEGLLPSPVPIHGVLGDSHGALFGQGCNKPGMVKATYGTGSSVAMNIGTVPISPANGIVTSVAWTSGGITQYELEGNINYTGAVIKWLVDDLGLISSSKESGPLAAKANREDETYLVPAFTGLGAPYWDSNARAVLCGMSSSTGRAEIVRAAEECIAYQITDIIRTMEEVSNISIQSLRTDGGPTKDAFLMQFQSDIANIPVFACCTEELSGLGAAYLCGISTGFYPCDLMENLQRTCYTPSMDPTFRTKKYNGWKAALKKALTQE